MEHMTTFNTLAWLQMYIKLQYIYQSFCGFDELAFRVLPSLKPTHLRQGPVPREMVTCKFNPGLNKSFKFSFLKTGREQKDSVQSLLLDTVMIIQNVTLSDTIIE